MCEKINNVLKKIFPVAFAFTKSVGMFVFGIIIHLIVSGIGSLLMMIPVVGMFLSAIVTLYAAASLLVLVVTFSKIFEAPTKLVGEDDQVSAILRKIFPISFKYSNKGKSLAIGIILNVIFMLLVSGVMGGLSLLLTATVVGMLVVSVVDTVATILNIYFIAAIVVEILLAVDVIKAAKPVLPVKAEKIDREEEKAAN